MKYTVSKIIKNELINEEEADYNYIFEELNYNFKEVVQGILNSLRHLFRHLEEEENKDKISNIIILLNEHLKKNTNKKDLDYLYNKIEEFINNLSLSLNKEKMNMYKEYITSLINIQNKCILNPYKRYNSEKYDFIIYLIFEKKDVSLLSKYLINNIKDLLINKKILSMAFSRVIYEYMNLDEDNTYMINYYNQVINLFLNGKIYDHLFNNEENHFLEVLKTSDKDFVWALIDKIENEFVINEETLAKDYNISLDFPSDLEKYDYYENGMVNLTNLDVLTIDSKDDTCLDDALSIVQNDNGTYTLYIHLANPTSLIPYSSNTMNEALKRTETIYLLDEEIPVYKDELSYDILSILPGKKTNTLTFAVPIDTDYSVILDEVEVFSSVIESKHKLSYDEVDEIINNPKNDKLSKDLVLLSKIFNKLSRSHLNILTLHKIENLATGRTNTNSSNSAISNAHMIVENSMIFVNRLPSIINNYYHLDLVLPYRVQKPYDEEVIMKALKASKTLDENNPRLKKLLRSYLPGGYYSHINVGHVGLGVDGYVRISSAARRAMDALAIYALDDLYLKRDEGNLDIKYYYWEDEIKNWCLYANNRIVENNNFANEYNYLKSKGKILKRK